MKWAIIGAALLTFIPHIASAQSAGTGADPNADLDIVSEPICFAIRNEADYNILGSVTTNYFTRPDGVRARHSSNFRLYKPGSINPHNGKKSDREEFCTYGPFLPDRQLTFTLRTLFPVFECKTRVDHGEIVIKGARRADDTGVETWAECYRADGTKTDRYNRK
jgi:hypothetical protein